MIDDTLLVLRSNDVSPDSGGVYRYDLAAPIIAKQGHYLALSVDSAAIPHSFYNVTTANNTVVVSEIVSTVTKVRVLSVPPGNYTATTLKTALTSELNSTTSTVSYTVSFTELTGKYTFSIAKKNSADSNISASIIGATTSLGPVLGLAQTTNHQILEGSPVTGNVADFVVHHHIAVESNLSSFSILDSKNKMQSTNLLALIPITAPIFGIIYHSASESHMKNVLTTQMLTSITIRMLGANNTVLDFNFVPWELTLRLQQLPAGPSPMLMTPDEEQVALLREIVHLLKDQSKPAVKAPTPAAAIVQQAIQQTVEETDRTLLGNI